MSTLSQRRRPAGPSAGAVRGSAGGIGRSSSPEAEAISDAMRRGASRNLARRRRTAALALAAISSFVPVAAYQTGLLRHLPDPPLPGLDSDAVDASGEAYHLLLTSDAALGIGSYAVTLALAGGWGRTTALKRSRGCLSPSRPRSGSTRREHCI